MTETKLLASDGAWFDYFGYSVSISGDIALVGAIADDDNGTDSGSAYVFVLSGGVWTQQAKLLASDGSAGDRFGYSVSVSGDVALVGATEDDDNGDASGSAYVFVRSGDVWTQEAKLLAGDGAAFDYFGYSLSISGDTVLVGADSDDDNGGMSGSAYVFVRSVGGWTEQAKLLASDGEIADHFGYSVSLSGDTALVGALGDDDNGDMSGSAYVFVRNGGVWTQQAKLLARDGGRFDQFGNAVSISGDTALLGAVAEQRNGVGSGAAYVFVRSDGAWTQEAKLLASDGVSDDHFGISVSLSGGIAVVGAYGDDDNGLWSGSVYVFARSGGAWTQQAKLLARDGGIGNRLGVSVSVSGDIALVGAHGDDDHGTYSGSAYVFGHGLDLFVSGDCPGGLTLDILGATPGGTVAIGWSRSLGSATIPVGDCAGTAAGLLEPQLLAIVPADDTGGYSTTVPVPARACGLYLQAVDLDSCDVSDVIQGPE